MRQKAKKKVMSYSETCHRRPPWQHLQPQCGDGDTKLLSWKRSKNKNIINLAPGAGGGAAEVAGRRGLG